MVGIIQYLIAAGDSLRISESTPARSILILPTCSKQNNGTMDLISTASTSDAKTRTNKISQQHDRLSSQTPGSPAAGFWAKSFAKSKPVPGMSRALKRSEGLHHIRKPSASKSLIGKFRFKRTSDGVFRACGDGLLPLDSTKGSIVEGQESGLATLSPEPQAQKPLNQKNPNRHILRPKPPSPKTPIPQNPETREPLNPKTPETRKPLNPKPLNLISPVTIRLPFPPLRAQVTWSC